LVAVDITTLKIQGLEDHAVLSWWFYFSRNQIVCSLTLEICGSVFQILEQPTFLNKIFLCLSLPLYCIRIFFVFLV